MSKTKLVLSAKELQMVNDTEWILTKQRIIQQVYHLLEDVVKDIDSLLMPNWNAMAERASSPPRIFKGENYLGLPYVTLDYPKLYDAENTLTVRTMFWWGNFMSVTLHAGSNHKNRLFEKLKERALRNHGMYVCIHEEQWHHHFEPDNYKLLDDLSMEQLDEISGKDFIKLAYKINLTEFNELGAILVKHYEMLAETMA